MPWSDWQTTSHRSYISVISKYHSLSQRHIFLFLFFFCALPIAIFNILSSTSILIDVTVDMNFVSNSQFWRHVGFFVAICNIVNSITWGLKYTSRLIWEKNKSTISNSSEHVDTVISGKCGGRPFFFHLLMFISIFYLFNFALSLISSN